MEYMYFYLFTAIAVFCFFLNRKAFCHAIPLFILAYIEAGLYAYWSVQPTVPLYIISIMVIVVLISVVYAFRKSKG